ncbi:MAG TPA: carbon starvation CstA family protein [Planctomycetota bacterium]|nr:carbon starvation CstA family protein [Planctomycetota bacterium]
MSALIPAGIGVAALALGYLVYSRLVTRWLGFPQDAKMPSEELYDGVDYVPAKHPSVLFGHHFASIAGAAPILGPVIACYVWGWVPALLWIVIGGIFFGALHDYFALSYSVVNKGRSICDLSGSMLGKAAKICFSVFVFLALVLVVAVFAAVAANTLVKSPEVVIPTFGLILVAVVIGVLMYHTKLNWWVTSIIGLALLAGLLVAGYYFPVSLTDGAVPEKAVALVVPGKLCPSLLCDSPQQAARAWTVILLAYSFIASVLPVWLLLQPRDHLSTGILFFGMLFGFLGLLLSRPAMRAPKFISFSSTQGWLWPMLFVIIACGAISGFHSLVSSGTTAKQLRRMKESRPIGYGAMIMESALALLAVICVSAGLYWKELPVGVAEGYTYQGQMKIGWIDTFGAGYGQITRHVLGSLGMLFGIVMLNAFIMTTLDSATRITRYVCTELVGDTFGLKVFRNRFVATTLVVVLAGWLALGDWGAIWPIFGASNQLIAAMVLIMATVYLVTRGRHWAFAGVPALLILITTLGALVYQCYGFLTAEEPKVLLAAISVVLIVLAGFVILKAVTTVRTVRREQTQV